MAANPPDYSTLSYTQLIQRMNLLTTGYIRAWSSKRRMYQHVWASKFLTIPGIASEILTQRGINVRVPRERNSVKGLNMGTVIAFRLNDRPTRQQAKQWLSANRGTFPEMPTDVGPVLFHGWRFVRGLDDAVYFANCIDPGITEAELQESEGHNEPEDTLGGRRALPFA